MKLIDLSELKQIQLDVLEEVDSFCVQNNIHYSLACGSCLGAIRHKGYIPWDDDIDIYIPRSDYNRFIKSFPIELNNIKVASLEREPKWDRAYAQAYDSRTIMKEYANTPIINGVYIDIYPVDEVPDSDNAWKRYNKFRRILIRIHEVRRIPIRWNRSVIKNIILLFGKILLLPFSSRQIAKYISYNAQRYNGKGYNRSFECVQGMLQKRPFKSTIMTNFIRVPFEDRHYMVMKDYDEYLSNGYGDYMKLPPIDKQIPHHQFEAYWK